MCKNLFTSEIKGNKRFICSVRGTAYCQLSVLQFPVEAIVNPESCKDYEKED